jgi:hypothetical protein
LYQRAIDARHVWALGELALMWEAAGNGETAERLARLAADAGHSRPLRIIAVKRADDPRWEQLLAYGLDADGGEINPA